MNLKKMERYLRVNLLGPGPRLMKKEFTVPRSHKGSETLSYNVTCYFKFMPVKNEKYIFFSSVVEET